jgi:hypothetical protein
MNPTINPKNNQNITALVWFNALKMEEISVKSKVVNANTMRHLMNDKYISADLEFNK